MKRPKLVFILLVLLLVAGAGIFIRGYKSPPEKALMRMMDATQKGRFRKAEKYTVSGLGIDLSNRRVKKLNKAIYKTLRYSVIETNKESNEAQITLLVTMVDMETLLTDISQEMLDESLGGKRLNDKRYYKLLVKRIQSGEEKTTTKTVTANMKYNSKKWKVDMDSSKLFPINPIV